jgi:hypothetical protein
LQLGNDGKLAGAVVSYCMQVGGLTKAVWNVMQEEFERGALGEEQMDIEYVRKVAAHICQIASIHLHALADQFEYPNPLTQLDV